jgi:hypothetical protein
VGDGPSEIAGREGGVDYYSVGHRHWKMHAQGLVLAHEQGQRPAGGHRSRGQRGVLQPCHQPARLSRWQLGEQAMSRLLQQAA